MASIIDFLDNSGFAKITVSAILGGIGFKIIEHFLNGKSFISEHTQLRAELRKELDAVRLEVHELRTEVDEWREKYYAQLTRSNEISAEVAHLYSEISRNKIRIDNSFTLLDKTISETDEPV